MAGSARGQTSEERANALVRTTISLADPALRISFLSSVIERPDVAELARALDCLCARAEQAEEDAFEALVSLVDAFNLERSAGAVQRLREEAAGGALLALERVVRQPVVSARPSVTPPGRVIEDAHGRTLTLGERKSLARRPDRDLLDRLLADPHPDVIRGVLRNPRVVEADVLRIAARRPSDPNVLTEIARTPRWIHRSRVRMAIMLNPDTPPEIATPITGLLLRQELRLVLESTHVSAAVRALCLERLERRPPARSAKGNPSLQ
ncbi:MAG: hypothetical protein ABIP89_00465 [Polyangiaceae bacterium]